MTAADAYIDSLHLFGMQFGLERMHDLLGRLGHPEREFDAIHVVGTNGKGSTTLFAEALLLAETRGEERVANVRRLLKLAGEYDPYQRQGLYRFLRFIDAQEEAEVELEPASAQTDFTMRSINRDNTIPKKSWPAGRKRWRAPMRGNPNCR